ncbi:MAG: hypothetical protein NZM12_09770 [Steroidobacteraceae bacterium]|nr:hypothetical protein [Steroidobacteraceae bacterium]MDW8258472.1 hypothetical protein [Gammaproteobacteria bacterium]
MAGAQVIDSGTGLRVPDAALITYTHVIYALHALSVLIGITTAASIVGAFVLGLPSIVAVIMNYVRQKDARGTFLEAHFRWQIRTFWGAVAMVAILTVISVPLLLVLVGFVVFPIGLIAIGIWVVYRVIRGWLALRDGRPVPGT